VFLWIPSEWSGFGWPFRLVDSHLIEADGEFGLHRSPLGPASTVPDLVGTIYYGEGRSSLGRTYWEVFHQATYDMIALLGHRYVMFSFISP